MNYRDFTLGDWIGHISGVIEDETTLDGNEMRDLVEFLTTMQEPKTEWIPIKTRPMTEEEAEHYSEYTDMRIADTYTILDCPLPDDGQEVLVSWGGNVVVDVFVRDDVDCFFEGVDIDEVDAWMPLPEPYKGVEE